MTSVILPPTCKTPSLRRPSYSSQQPPPPLPPRPSSRRHTPALPALHLQTGNQAPKTQKSPKSPAMSSRYTRPLSPRGRYAANPARSSTGTFDPYYDSTYYGRPASPRTSAERVGGGSHYSPHSYAPSSASTTASSRASNLKYDSYSGRPRGSTLTESDRGIWPNVGPTTPTALPIRTHTSHGRHEGSASPPRSWDNRGDTFVTHGATPHRREHKRIYSVEDGSHTTKLIAEKDIIEPRRREADERSNHSLTSGGRTYQQHKPSLRASDVGDDGYSYTDPASMYRDTEPAWRRPRSGSVERSARPTSMIMERTPRTSNRELGPPPSTRGFDKINNSVHRNGSRHRGQSPSLERSRDTSKYEPYPDPYPEVLPPRPASTAHHAPAIHQDPLRDSYSDYGRPDRDGENRRYTSADQFDPDVAKRGFGLASPIVGHAPGRPTSWASEPPRTRPAEYYPTDRPEARLPEPRLPREREVTPVYEERPRERDRDRRDSTYVTSSAVPSVAGAAAGAAATLGAAGLLKARNKDRDSERERERERELELEKEREQRREWDERDRRDRISDDRRDRVPEQRRERILEDRRDWAPEERLPPVSPSYASIQEADRKPRHYEGDDREKRSRKVPSPEGSGDERPRPRHYVDPEAVRETDRRKETVPQETPLDPDEEYRRRIQQEAERSGRGRDPADSNKERDRSRHRDRSRGPSSHIVEPPRARYDDRLSHVVDNDIVQEPDLFSKEQSRAVQIVAPPKEPTPQPKGILRKPTEKFPEEPEPIREGVAPHKSQMKGKDIPINARWTKIDRKLVNPEALDEAKERFEERLDCVIVLRVLTKQEIQKLADRTKAIREAREVEYERDDVHHDHHDRDRERRSRRSHRDEDDRDRHHDYDDSEDDIGRDRPRAIEAVR
ncbi:hypothetical protein P280DRAFT_387884 [Massarina eburnea CBS 473.64]|uniref:DUF8035 domain-containing protein n=1 Tax=Massarina eburnea CBS 473.64 TaxID=1395130 RepID=A0A6A6SFE1_9PLEO|nr:hypothetical protein P280DRAFT_387884 [Massarina eburnea CBS 473.64]